MEEERKFYSTELIFYVNGIKVYDFELNGIYYGYLRNSNSISKKVKDVNELWRILCDLNLGNEVTKYIRKVKIFGTTFKKEDIKEIKIIKQQVDKTLFVREMYDFNRLMKALSVDEFIQFCIDNGLAVVNLNK